MTHAEWIKHVRKQWRRRKDDTPLSHAARLIRLEADAYDGTGQHKTVNWLLDLADRLEQMGG